MLLVVRTINRSISDFNGVDSKCRSLCLAGFRWEVLLVYYLWRRTCLYWWGFLVMTCHPYFRWMIAIHTIRERDGLESFFSYSRASISIALSTPCQCFLLICPSSSLLNTGDTLKDLPRKRTSWQENDRHSWKVTKNKFLQIISFTCDDSIPLNWISWQSLLLSYFKISPNFHSCTLPILLCLWLSSFAAKRTLMHRPHRSYSPANGSNSLVIFHCPFAIFVPQQGARHGLLETNMSEVNVNVQQHVNNTAPHRSEYHNVPSIGRAWAAL